MFHVKHASPVCGPLSDYPEAGQVRDREVPGTPLRGGGPAQVLRMTTKRLGSTPRELVSTPGTSATASCTSLRS